MDPDANLREQLVCADRIARIDERTTDEDRLDEAERLAALVVALNDWLQRGGALPRNWRSQRS